MITIAVTGSSGFIGRHMVHMLKGSNYQVIELDLAKGHDITKSGCFENLPVFDWIIHLAAQSFVPLSFENPHLFYHDNILSTLNVLEAARKTKAKVIYFSSYLYGAPQYLPVDEEHPVVPHNPYAQSKFLSEKLCEGYHRDFGLDVTVFRPFNIYGKGQNPSFILPSIVEQMKSGSITLKDPRPKRDFVHVLDVINAVQKVIELHLTGYHVFNLGSGISYSIDEIVNIISSLINEKLEVNFTNEFRKGEVLDTVANINKAMAVLHWSPKVELINGLKTFLYD